MSSGTTVDCSTNLSSSVSLTYATEIGYDPASATLPVSITQRYTDPELGAQTAVTKLEYDPYHPGLVTKVIPPRGNTGSTPDYSYATTFSYFPTNTVKAGLLASVTDPVGNQTTYDYDAIGRRIKMVDPNGNAPGGAATEHTWEYVYDQEDRLRLTKAPAPTAGGAQLVTEFRYDAVGNREVVLAPNGQVTKYASDERDSLLRVLESPDPWTDPAVLPSRVITTEYSYDGNDNLTRLLRAKGSTDERATDYQYDGMNRLVKELQYPSWPTTTSTLTTTYAYDPNGNRTSLVDPNGKTTSYTYDALNRLTGITYGDPNTPNVTYAYDANGNRTSLVDGTGTTSYTYHELDRLLSVTSPDPKTVGYRYDRDGNRTKIIYPDTTAVTYSFDKASWLASLRSCPRIRHCSENR